ncbi:MAG: segregation and condensation protein A [Coraliomargaritaceae bacterium]
MISPYAYSALEVAFSSIMQDALLQEQEHAIRLPDFEGPLDLLLYLIQRNELDIYDIPIETVTRQYIDLLNAAENIDLETAGEFFVMAATLMYIKSRMLLPKKDRVDAPDEEEENIDPRWELVRQLVEYKKFKEASAEIENLILHSHDRIARIGPKESVEAVERPLQPVERIGLWNTFNQVLRRLAERITEGEIQAEQVSVADRMEHVLLHLKQREHFLFSELFDSITSMNAIVATFLAVLELARMGTLQISQDTAFADIRCQRGQPEAVEL